MVGQVEDKDPKGLPCMKHLFTLLLLIREDTHTLSLQVCISASLCLKKTVSLCVLPAVVVLSLIINFVPAFIVSASVNNACFTGDKAPGKK